MEYIDTGGFLIIQWIKTFIIFTLVDRILLGEKIINSLKNHNTYISSLLVSAFLIIMKAQDFSIISFIFWGIIMIVIYGCFKKIKDFFIK